MPSQLMGSLLLGDARHAKLSRRSHRSHRARQLWPRARCRLARDCRRADRLPSPTRMKPDASKCAQKRLGMGKNAYADYRQMLQKERPHVVSVADRHLDLHRDMVIACVRAKPKGVGVTSRSRSVASLAEERTEMIAGNLREASRQGRDRRIKTRLQPAPAARQGDHRRRPHRRHPRIAWSRQGGRPRPAAMDLMVLGTHLMDLMRFLAMATLALVPGECRRRR